MIEEQSAGVSGILLVGGKSLVIRRASHESEQGWEFVKGKVEFGEAPKDAISREYMEETNLRVEVESILDIFSWTYDRGNKRFHVVEIVYNVVLAPGESIQSLELSEDHDESRLVDASDVKSLEPMVKGRRDILSGVLGT